MAGGGKIRLGPGNKGLLRRGAHRAKGGKIRLGDLLFPGEAVTGLEAERSVLRISCSQKRRSPGWTWNPYDSAGWRGSDAGQGCGALGIEASTLGKLVSS